MNVSYENITDYPACFDGSCSQCSDNIYVGVCAYQAMAILCFLLIVPIHISLIWRGQYRDWRTTSTHLWGLNANILELVFCVEGVVTTVNHYVCERYVLDYMLYIMQSLTWISQPMLHTWTCVEWYIAIIFPTKYSQVKAVKFKRGILGAVWTVSLSYSLLVSLPQNPLCFDPAMLTVLSFSAVVMTFCGVSVLCGLRRPGPADGQRAGQDVQKRRAFTSILTLQGFLMLTYTPRLVELMTLVETHPHEWSCSVAYALSAWYVGGVMLMTLHGLYKEGTLPCLKR